MAKSKGYKLPGLNKALKAVDALGASMTAEADADYAVALSAMQAGQRGLAKQTRGLTRDLLAGQLKSSASLSKLAKTARAQKNVVADQQAKTTNRYGSALGQSIAQSYKPAKAIASGTGKLVTGAAKAGKATAGVAGTVAGIAQAGVAAQRQAAKYSLNQALQQRAIIDNQTLAGLTGQLYQTALQYNMQMAMYEKQRADAAADARKAELGATKDTLEFLGSETPAVSAWLDTATDTMKDELYTDGALDPAKVRAAYAAHMGIDLSVPLDPASQDAARMNLITEIARKMADGQNISTATESAMNTLYQGMEGWEKLSGSTILSIQTGITAAEEAQALANLNNIGALTVTTSGMQNLMVHAEEEWGWLTPGDVDPMTSNQFRDAGATHILDTLGSATAKAWLRGQTGWSDPAIDSYLSTLHAGESTTEGFNIGG
jgi:hypothetical protein